MHTQSLKSTFCGLVLIAGLAGSAWGAQFTVHLDGYGSTPGPAMQWQPQPNLFAAMTVWRDFTFYDRIVSGFPPDPVVVEKFGAGVARAAAYGSDSSVQDGSLDPRMNGFSVEPMAEAEALAEIHCTRNGVVHACPGGFGLAAQAYAEVNHRIVARDPSNVPISPGDKVPVVLEYSLHAWSSYASPPDNYSGGFAGFSIEESGSTLFYRRTCSIAGIAVNCTSVGDDSGSWSAGLNYSDFQQQTIYSISAGAVTTADPFSGHIEGTTVHTMSVADPFLHIDPSWQYASYFMVQQESVLHPGEWLEVSRVWMQPVPEPASGTLLALGLAGVLGAVRTLKARAAAAG